MLNFSHFTNTFFLSFLLLFSACSQDQKVTTSKIIPAIKVDTITIKKEPIAIWKRYTGTTKATSAQDVRARVSGILEKIYFEDGASVTKGQKLFLIEQTQYQASLDEARANKRKNLASLKKAKADVDRYAPLAKEGLAPRATLEQYQAEYEGYEASISGDNAKIKIAELNLSYTAILAPISGRVSARNVDVGNLVGQGEATLLTTIMSIDPIYAYFSPSQKDITLIRKYSKKEKTDAFIEVQGKMETLRLDGFVDFKNNQVDPSTSTVSMRATISNSDAQVMPGTFVHVNIFINDEFEFRMIPPEIIFNDQLGKFVYIVDSDNKARRVSIQTSYDTKYYIDVKEGLKDGDRVIVSALPKLRNGLKVDAHDATDTKGIQAIIKKNNLIPSKIK